LLSNIRCDAPKFSRQIVLCREEEPIQALIIASRNKDHVLGGVCAKARYLITPIFDYTLPDCYFRTPKIDAFSPVWCKYIENTAA
jgi:hypothetical protein